MTDSFLPVEIGELHVVTLVEAVFEGDQLGPPLLAGDGDHRVEGASGGQARPARLVRHLP